MQKNGLYQLSNTPTFQSNSKRGKFARASRDRFSLVFSLTEGMARGDWATIVMLPRLPFAMGPRHSYFNEKKNENKLVGYFFVTEYLFTSRHNMQVFWSFIKSFGCINATQVRSIINLRDVVYDQRDPYMTSSNLVRKSESFYSSYITVVKSPVGWTGWLLKALINRAYVFQSDIFSSRTTIGFKSDRNRIIPTPNPGQNESLVMSVIYYPITLPLGQISHCLAFSEYSWCNNRIFEFPSAFSMLLFSQQRLLFKNCLLRPCSHPITIAFVHEFKIHFLIREDWRGRGREKEPLRG